MSWQGICVIVALCLMLVVTGYRIFKARKDEHFKLRLKQNLEPLVRILVLPLVGYFLILATLPIPALSNLANETALKMTSSVGVFVLQTIPLFFVFLVMAGMLVIVLFVPKWIIRYSEQEKVIIKEEKEKRKLELKEKYKNSHWLIKWFMAN